MQFQLFLAILSAAMATSMHGVSMKDTLQAKYDAISNAFSHKDGSVIERIYAPKFVLIGTSGRKIERKEVISDYKREMEQLTDITWPRTLDAVTVTGSTATVTVHGKFHGTQTTKDGKHQFESDSVCKDTWTRQGGSWVLSKSQVLSLQATYDKRRLNRG